MNQSTCHLCAIEAALPLTLTSSIASGPCSMLNSLWRRRETTNISHPRRGSEAELRGRSAAEVCTSAARKTAGNPLRRAIGAEP
jgi:hypothetical protein